MLQFFDQRRSVRVSGRQVHCDDAAALVRVPPHRFFVIGPWSAGGMRSRRRSKWGWVAHLHPRASDIGDQFDELPRQDGYGHEIAVVAQRREVSPLCGGGYEQVGRSGRPMLSSLGE